MTIRVDSADLREPWVAAPAHVWRGGDLGCQSGRSNDTLSMADMDSAVYELGVRSRTTTGISRWVLVWYVS
jgi:hypothetical protein